MDVERFCQQSNVVVVVGKGGVGKTTVTAALALAAARSGLDVLVVALDDSGALPGLFGVEEAFGYEEVVLRPGGNRARPVERAVAGDTAGTEATAPGDGQGDGGGGPERVAGRVRGRVLTSDAALIEYLVEHGLGRVSRRLASSGALDVVATAIPGVEEVLVLGKLKQLERAQVADVVLLDAPATGHAVTFLTSSGGLVDAARGGPLRTQAEQVVELLTDPARCQALLVTIPEETPVNELVETAFRLEDEVGVALGPVVVNGCYPVLTHLGTDPAAAAAAAGVPAPGPETAERLRSAAAFRESHQELQQIQLQRLSRELPLAQLRLPYLFSASIGPGEIGTLAGALAESIADLP
ncbi:MAG TPA: ArsA-related P-loop ATPase [Acidimicrobiales bacterium]|nr:ArsA-related P-loop ATPase [Acidimicrobiales bacterium]